MLGGGFSSDDKDKRWDALLIDDDDCKVFSL